MKCGSGIGFSIAMLLLAFSGGCAANLDKEHRVRNQPEAGALNLAVTQIAPWEEYVAALTPAFELTSDTALAKVLPTTTLVEEKLIDSLAGTLRIGLPTSGITRTETTTSDGTSSTTAIERVESKGQGALPTAPTPNADSPSSLPGVPDVAKKIEDEPVLQYQNALALYQEVQLLNRYVTDAALVRGHRPFIVRLQIQVLPYARNQPYDVFANLGFFYCSPETSGDNVGKCRRKEIPEGAATVIPLIVTDNLESTAKSKSAEIIRQLATAISFIEGGIAAELGLARGWRRLNSVLGSDLNGLFTVGRITDNSIAVRLGAARQATAGYAMVPRTHNVTLLVMVPDKDLQKMGPNPTLRVVGHWTLRHAQTGHALERGEPREHLAAKVPELKKLMPEKFNHKARELTAQRLIQFVYRNDYPAFRRTINGLKEANGVADVVFERDIWMALLEVFAPSHIVAARAELPVSSEPPIASQAVLLSDDGKRTTATLVGGRRINAAAVRAHLRLSYRENEETVVLPAESISVGPGGANLTLAFPSISAWRIGPLKQDGLRLKDSALIVGCCSNGWDTDSNPTFWHVGQIYYRRGDTDSTVIALKQQSTVFTVNQENATATVKVWVEFAKANDKQIAASAELSVLHAEVLKPALNAKGVHVSVKDGPIEFELRNPEDSVQITVVAKDAKGAVVGAPAAAVKFTKTGAKTAQGGS
jgi:hypothetical protein